MFGYGFVATADDVDRLMYDAKQDGRDCVKCNRRVA